MIAFVGEDMIRRHPFEQGLDLGDVVAFPADQDEADRIARRIGGGVNLGAQAAFGASQRELQTDLRIIAFFGAPALC